MNDFKIGDIAWLKSGGPPMTVTMFNVSQEFGIVETEWFSGNELRRDAFLIQCLVKNDPFIPVPIQLIEE